MAKAGRGAAGWDVDAGVNSHSESGFNAMQDENTNLPSSGGRVWCLVFAGTGINQVSGKQKEAHAFTVATVYLQEDEPARLLGCGEEHPVHRARLAIPTMENKDRKPHFSTPATRLERRLRRTTTGTHTYVLSKTRVLQQHLRDPFLVLSSCCAMAWRLSPCEETASEASNTSLLSRIGLVTLIKNRTNDNGVVNKLHQQQQQRHL